MSPRLSGVALAALSTALFAASLPRTFDGHPELSGFWTNATLIPLERPVELGNNYGLANILAAARASEK